VPSGDEALHAEGGFFWARHCKGRDGVLRASEGEEEEHKAAEDEAEEEADPGVGRPTLCEARDVNLHAWMIVK
jgi:predicted NUDIX family NTP pyrophosphohydrolase